MPGSFSLALTRLLRALVFPFVIFGRDPTLGDALRTSRAGVRLSYGGLSAESRESKSRRYLHGQKPDAIPSVGLLLPGVF